MIAAWPLPGHPFKKVPNWAATRTVLFPSFLLAQPCLYIDRKASARQPSLLSDAESLNPYAVRI